MSIHDDNAITPEEAELLQALQNSDIDFYDVLADGLLAAGSHTILPQNDDELWEYIAREYGLQIPRVAVCEHHVSPFQAIADAYFGRVTNAVWVGPRSGGKTLGFAILDHLLIDHFGVEIANVGAIEAQANKCYSYIERFVLLPQFRDHLLKPPMISKTFLKNGGFIQVLPGTMNQVNSPHPNRAHLDEIELMDPRVIEEAKSMPIRQKGRPPATIWTSSRKKPFGPMEDLLGEAAERGIRTYFWCAFEIVEKCPETRHQQGVGCETCPLMEICKDRVAHPDGTWEYVAGPGKAARAEGWLPIDDLIDKFLTLDRLVFDSQWLCKKPVTHGLAFPMFEDDTHVIDYEYNPAYPVICGIDFGYTNPSCALYGQPTPNDELVIFAEDYKARRSDSALAESMKKEPWFEKTAWRVGDSAARSSRETLIEFGVPNEAAQKEGTPEEPSSRKSTVDLIRYLLEPQGRQRPLLFVSRDCKNLIREMKRYHYPEEKPDQNIKEDAVKVDDHAVDALRYMAKRAYRKSIAV